RLLLANGVLYGTTQAGGASGSGTIFKMNPDGSGFAVLKSFGSSEGETPRCDLILAGTTLYGTTDNGGSYGAGTVFKINTDGSGFAVLKSFGYWPNLRTNGFYPSRSLTIAGSKLYGGTRGGGASGDGTLFRMNTDGSGFLILK